MVAFGLEPTLVLNVGTVELKLLDNLGTQFLGREDYHLVIDLAALAHEFHALEQGGTGTSAGVILGNEDDRFDIVYTLGGLQV